MPWISLAGAGLGLLGSSMQANATRDAAQTAADAQLQAARVAAEEARFRPVGVTTRFGTSQFQFNPEGRVTSAGYTVSPELQAYQNRLSALANQGLAQAEAAPGQFAPLGTAAGNLFGLGQQYLAQTPESVAQQYMSRQLDLLAPSRERQYAQLQNQLFQTGRGGLSVGATGMRPGGGAGLSAANPELEAYYNAIAQQDAALAAQAQQAGQQQLAFGTTLFNTGAGLLGQQQQGQVGALSPFTSYLGGVQNIESLGQQPLSLGASLGGGNTASAQALLTGGTNAAATMLPANMLNPTADFLATLADKPQTSQAASAAWNQLKGLFGGSAATSPSFAGIYGPSGGISGGWGYSGAPSNLEYYDSGWGA